MPSVEVACEMPYALGLVHKPEHTKHKNHRRYLPLTNTTSGSATTPVIPKYASLAVSTWPSSPCGESLAATRVNVLPSAENAAPIAYAGNPAVPNIAFAPLYIIK